MTFHLFNPLSLMKFTRLFRNFIFMFSLLALGNFAWGERYETVFVYTEDTEVLNDASARAYLKSNTCISSQSLIIPQGNVAYVFASGATDKPNGTLSLTGTQAAAKVAGLRIDLVGLDNNQTYGWDPNSLTTGYQNPPSNVVHSQPITGPATIKAIIKPRSGRASSSSYADRWAYSSYGNWDFKASEGYVTFRITGSEQAPSKKFATVIPENASGNVRIVLEQSTDLINWSSANPGIFPPSTSKRFFRVRSVEE